ncbi:CU044_5270 family protein [Nonomuraea antimicrobica]
MATARLVRCLHRRQGRAPPPCRHDGTPAARSCPPARSAPVARSLRPARRAPVGRSFPPVRSGPAGRRRRRARRRDLGGRAGDRPGGGRGAAVGRARPGAAGRQRAGAARPGRRGRGEPRVHRPRPDQWIYIERRVQGVPQPTQGEVQTPGTPLESRVGRSWTRADGKEVAVFEDGELVRSPTGGGMPPLDYATVAALPTDPGALLAWMYENLGDIPRSDEDRHNSAYRLLGSLLAQNLVPPAQEAAVYRALARIPGVTVNPDAVDVDGRPAVAVSRTEDGWVSHELLLDRSTYTYLGERSIASADHTAPGPGTRVEEGRKIVNMGHAYAIKKGTIMTLAVRLDIGVTDRPGVKP